METVIPALIVIALLLLAAFMIFEMSLSAQESVATSWLEMQERVEERARTNISAGAISDCDVVTITLSNEGDTKLANFDQWDVILQYESGSAEWYPYTTTVAVADTWTNDIDGVFEENIFNPEENMVITVTLSTPVGLGTTNRAIIATPNGVTASTMFTCE